MHVSELTLIAPSGGTQEIRDFNKVIQGVSVRVPSS